MKKLLFTILLILVSRSAFCDDTDRSAEYILNSVFDSTNNAIRVDDNTGILSLTDPNVDRIYFWDDSSSSADWLELGTGLSISGTTLNATASGGWTDNGTDINLSTTTDNVGIGSSSFGKVSILGDSDECQFCIKANGTHTNSPVVNVMTSTGSSLFAVSNDGSTTIGGTATPGLSIGTTSVTDVNLSTTLSGATDPVIRMNNAMVTVSHDLTVSGDDIIIGSDVAGVKLTDDGDGQITIKSLSTGSAEDVTLNLDDTSNTAVWSSTTGVTNHTFTSASITIGGTGTQSTITEGLIVNNGSGTDTDDSFRVNGGGVNAMSVDGTTGRWSSAMTSNLGWTPVNAADQACNTTCTSACVFGMNTGALGNFVDCTNATADTCICAGAS